MERSSEETGFASLPPLCVALILSHTTAQDVCVLAPTCTLFGVAAGFDSVWERLLRHSSVAQHIICAVSPIADAASASTTVSAHALVVQDNPSLLNYLSYRNLYFHLCNPLLFSQGSMIYWLDKSSGRENYSVSARSLSIIWGNDTRYWEWIANAHGSRFQEIAHLLDVCWFEVHGQLKTELQHGTYIMLFRIKMVEANGWNQYPVTFNLSTSTGVEKHSRKFLNTIGMRSSSNDWIEIEVGRFTIEDTQGMIELNFSMSETKGNNWKSGLMLDGAVIRSVL